MSDLKPCPFCGGEAVVLNAQPDGYHSEFIIACANCKVATEPYEIPEEAAEMWNRRESDGCDD